jgi:chemotaxis protein histidine kinase CheA
VHVAVRPPVDEFLAEALETIDELDAASAQLQGPSPPLAALEVAARCVHTLVGNSRSFDRADYADLAAGVLDRLRRAPQDAAGAVQGLRGLLARFVEVSREYLPSAFDPQPAGLDAIRELRHTVGSGGAAPPSSGRGAVDESLSDAEVRRLLSGAPPVRPRLEEFRRLVEEHGGPVRSAPKSRAAPLGAVEIEAEARKGGCRSALEARTAPSNAFWEASGFAVEVRGALALLATFPAATRQDPRSAHTLLAFEDLLHRALAWLERRSLVPLADVLNRTDAELRRHLSGAVELSWPPAVTDTQVSAGTAMALEYLLGKVLAVLAASQCIAAAARPAEVPVEVETRGRLVRIALRAGDGVERRGLKLRLFALQERAGGVEAKVSFNEEAGEVCVECPSRLPSLDVVLLAAGGTRFAVPRHRILEERELSGAERAAVLERREVEVCGELATLLDLTAPGDPAGPSAGEERTGRLVVLDGHPEKTALLVDAALGVERRILVAALAAREAGELAGCCVAPDGSDRVPMLEPAAL